MVREFKRRTMLGIEISVIVKGGKFDLCIDIAEDADISEEIKGDGYLFRLTFKDGRTTPGEHLHFEKKNKPYSFNRKRNNLKDSSHIIRTDEYKLSVVLSPSFYASKEEIRELEKKRIKSKAKIKANAKKKKGKRNGSLGGRFSGDGYKVTNYTNYSYTNASRPYSGGLCSPK